MHYRLNDYLVKSNCYHSFQFGFRFNLSTDNTLMLIVQKIKNRFDKGEFNAGVFVNLKSVFDTVNRGILFSKLDHYSVTDVARKAVLFLLCK